MRERKFYILIAKTRNKISNLLQIIALTEARSGLNQINEELGEPKKSIEEIEKDNKKRIKGYKGVNDRFAKNAVATTVAYKKSKSVLNLEVELKKLAIEMDKNIDNAQQLIDKENEINLIKTEKAKKKKEGAKRKKPRVMKKISQELEAKKYKEATMKKEKAQDIDMDEKIDSLKKKLTNLTANNLELISHTYSTEAFISKMPARLENIEKFNLGIIVNHNLFW